MWQALTGATPSPDVTSQFKRRLDIFFIHTVGLTQVRTEDLLCTQELTQVRQTWLRHRPTPNIGIINNIYSWCLNSVYRTGRLFESTIHRELFTWEYPKMIVHLIVVLRTLSARSLSFPYITTLRMWKKKRGMDLFPFYLPVQMQLCKQLVHPLLPVWLEKSLNLAHLVISYCSHPAHFSFYVCLFHMTWFIFVRGSGQ